MNRCGTCMGYVLHLCHYFVRTVGDGPAAYFWADESQAPSDMGLRLYDSEPVGACGKAPLSAADGTATYRFEFPIGSTINDFLGGCEYQVVLLDTS